MKEIKNSKFKIQNFRVLVDGREIIKDVSLEIGKGEIHALMGPNGSGKSTLAYALMGHPGYKVEGGSLKFEGRDLLKLKPEKRAQLGLFLGFQYPLEVAGVSVFNFLKTASESLGKKIPPKELLSVIKGKLSNLKLGTDFISRSLNEGFSGGEKKRSEVLQALVLKPKIAIFDEPDSGLDIDGVRKIAEAIQDLARDGTGVLLITHYQRILNYVPPHFVHVMVGGRIVESGGPELAQKLEERGYEIYG